MSGAVEPYCFEPGCACVNTPANRKAKEDELRLIELAALLFPHIEVTTLGAATCEMIAERRAVQAVHVARAMLAEVRGSAAPAEVGQ